MSSPSQNFEVDIFLILSTQGVHVCIKASVLSSSLVANFQPFWSPRSNQFIILHGETPELQQASQSGLVDHVHIK